ncbi:hypothetical protein ATERTT37_007499 [Aspergillus terreus]
MPTPARLDTHKKGKGLQTPQSMVDVHADDTSGPIQASSFRNVSSCTRCRQRKSRCDQQLPQCGACEKAGARCVGYDPLMKREVPRSYLYYLEDRVNYFKNLLSEHGVSFEPDSSLTMERSAPHDYRASTSEERDTKASYKRRGSVISTSGTDSSRPSASSPRSPREATEVAPQSEIDTLHSTHDPGCCTAHELLFALRPRSLTSSFVLPDRDLAAKLVNFYFEQAYPQVPALHKGEVAQLLNRTYAGAESHRPYSLFLLYILFAIGTCIMLDNEGNLRGKDVPGQGLKRKRNTLTNVHPAEEYYSAAVTHLHLAFSSCDNASSKLEGLEAAVLIAHLSLFYPIRPGPVYLVGLALRAAVDVKLYDEASPSLIAGSYQATISNEGSEQQDQLSEQCQRLWWSAYSLDRLVSPYTGRPFAIPDHLVTTGFPSMPEEMGVPCHGISSSNKLMNFLTSHLLQLRLLQSEIHEVLQYHHAQSSRSNSSTTGPPATSILSSPLDYFESFGSWKRDVNRRLDEWKSCIPSREETGTWVPIVRLELDYWKTINLLYRHEVKVPFELARMLPPSHMNATHLAAGEGSKDDFTHFKIVEASRKVLQSYRLTLDEIDCTILTGTAVLAGMADIYPHARECQDSLERMRVATMQMCLSSTKPESGITTPRERVRGTPTTSTSARHSAHPTESPQTILKGLPRASAFNLSVVPELEEPSKDLHTEPDLPEDFESALTQLFPEGDDTPPLVQDEPRFRMGVVQEGKGESVFSLDFLDIELLKTRSSSSGANSTPDGSADMEALLRDASNPKYNVQSVGSLDEMSTEEMVDITVV